MDTEIVLTIASLIIGLLGFLFGIYKHYSTRKYASLSYETTQLTDFDFPSDFLDSMTVIPMSITIRNIGNKKAERVNIRIKTETDIENHSIQIGEPFGQEVDSRNIKIHVPSFNPGENAKVSLQCSKTANIKNYLSQVVVNHAEGVGVDRRTISLSEIIIELPIPFWRPSLKYNFEKRRFEMS